MPENLKDFLITGQISFTIIYPNYGTKNRNLGNLMDWLDNFDIVTASELGGLEIIYNKDVYKFGLAEEFNLARFGKISLRRLDKLDNYLDLSCEEHVSFRNWYYNLNPVP